MMLVPLLDSFLQMLLETNLLSLRYKPLPVQAVVGVVDLLKKLVLKLKIQRLVHQKKKRGQKTVTSLTLKMKPSKSMKQRKEEQISRQGKE